MHANNRDKSPSGEIVLWDERKLCSFLGIKPATAQRWRWAGGGPRFIKVGRLVKYRPEDVEAWLQRHTREGEGGESCA